MLKKYYVRTDTYWQNSPDNWFGPFESRKAAQEWIDDQLNDPTQEFVMVGNSPTNIKDAVRIHGIYSKTEARRLGLRSYSLGDYGSNLDSERDF